jgi:hypothetical protein
MEPWYNGINYPARKSIVALATMDGEEIVCVVFGPAVEVGTPDGVVPFLRQFKPFAEEVQIVSFGGSEGGEEGCLCEALIFPLLKYHVRSICLGGLNEDAK